jgi:hypothetical protein
MNRASKILVCAVILLITAIVCTLRIRSKEVTGEAAGGEISTQRPNRNAIGQPENVDSESPITLRREQSEPRFPKIDEADVIGWLELPLEEWLVLFDERAPNAHQMTRHEIIALMAEFQKAVAGGLAKDHPHFESRVKGILDRFYDSCRRYEGKS